MPIRLKEAIAQSRQRVREDAVIEARAGLLPAEDRRVLLAVWTYQQPTRMVAEMCGTSPRALRRRVRRLVDRLHSQEFVGAARIMRFLNARQAELARLHVCQGLSVRRAAEAMGITYHEARRVASEVRGLIRALKPVTGGRRAAGDGGAGDSPAGRARRGGG